MKKMLLLSALVSMIAYSTHAVAAGDEGLYPAAPPPGSSYIRFIEGTAVPSVRGKVYAAPRRGKLGPYAAVEAGEAEIVFGDAKLTQKLAAGKFYSVTAKGTVLEDPAFADRMKARVQLINLTALPDVSLKSSDGQVQVIAPLQAGTSAVRDVNAVTAGFAVFAGNEKIGEVSETSLERGASYGVIVYEGKNGKPAVGYDKAEVK